MAAGANRRRGPGRERATASRVARGARATAAAATLGAALLLAGPPALAQAPGLGAQFAPSPTARMLVEANELVYDNDRDTVSAVGDVEINYDGRILQADRVVYDRRSGRVVALGAARLTDRDGTVVTGERIELTEDFRDGFIDSLRVEQTVVEDGRTATGRFTAPRAERIGGETLVFERGLYTTCEPCAENPARPPLWQVKAARIVHDNRTRTIYYENASLEFLGVPIAYVPYFWSPDPTVRRKTGFLSPTFVFSQTLGNGASIPFFWAIAPNYDLTVRPTYLSRQGFLGDVEWRHRLLTGAYSIRAVGIFERSPQAFRREPSPGGYGEDDARGVIESVGRFDINPRWRFGWNVTLLSDRFFLSDYGVDSTNVTTTLRSEAVSSLYLLGRGERSFFEARGYYFEGLSSQDFQKHQPIVHPVVDYDRRFEGPEGIGGEVGLNVNLTSLSREAAQFQPLRANGRTVATPGPAADYATCVIYERDCLALGLSGSYTRVSAQASWRRRFVDDLGQTWTPFAYARLDGIWFSPNAHGFENRNIRAFTGRDDSFYGRALPGVGLEYRFPLLAALPGGTHVIEPIAQVVARASEAQVGEFPNEDAQSLVFDESTLFEWDKFSGYDRVEGGTRANYGLQYTFTGHGGASLYAMVGQSAQIGGRNSFALDGLVDTGRGSGLDRRFSDYVARLDVRPNEFLRFGARARIGREDFDFERVEADVSGRFGPVSASLLYARFAAQPEIGFDRDREGLVASGRLDLTRNWFLNGSLALDLDRYRDTATVNVNDNVVTSYALGAGYADECTAFTVTFAATPVSGSDGGRYNRTVLFRLELLTLGEIGVQQSLGGGAAER